MRKRNTKITNNTTTQCQLTGRRSEISNEILIRNFSCLNVQWVRHIVSFMEHFCGWRCCLCCWCDFAIIYKQIDNNRLFSCFLHNYSLSYFCFKKCLSLTTLAKSEMFTRQHNFCSTAILIIVYLMIAINLQIHVRLLCECIFCIIFFLSLLCVRLSICIECILISGNKIRNVCNVHTPREINQCQWCACLSVNSSS